MIIRGNIKLQDGKMYTPKGTVIMKDKKWWQFWISKDYIPEKHPKYWTITTL